MSVVSVVCWKVEVSATI